CDDRTNMTVLGVDVGGTKIACARVDSLPSILDSVTLPTRADAGCEVSLAQIFAAIDACLTPEVRAIGICAPGPLNPKTGVVINPPNLPGWHDVPLAELVSRRYGVPCSVENDANAAGLAEALYGAARGCSIVFYVTLSTGIGTGIVFDGRVYHGRTGAAGEGGHVSIDYRSPVVCNCGVPGCVEALASGSALASRGLDPRRLNDCELDELATMIGAWLGGVLSLLDPDVIVIGGGLSRIGEPLFARLRRIVPQRTINQSAAETPILAAALGDDVGVLGAAAVVLSKLQ
ncbi:MAG TPA: ROK family protein, partial [Bryobacteraceae bacterium]|nr:ROK family protein [Bryobacteraceae bacterium]